jgi:hypothetical protein
VGDRSHMIAFIPKDLVKWFPIIVKRMFKAFAIFLVKR